MNISYSAVGMPRTISQVAISSDGADDGMLASYTYLDDGTKLSVTTPDGDGRVYRGSFVYGEDGSTVEQVLLDEGMFEKASGDAEGSNYGYRSLWFMKDQVGSVVSVINITDSDASADDAVVMKTGYLPFGSERQNANFVSDASMRYRFNDKETLPRMLDYGARHYDPLTCSWTTVDPMAGKYPGWSPYAFCAGDPVNFVDPDGRDYWMLNRDGTIVRLLDNSEINRLLTYDKEGYYTGSFDVSDDSIFRALSHKRETDTNREISSTLNIDEQTAYDLFIFCANNSDVEWAIHKNFTHILES